MDLTYLYPYLPIDRRHSIFERMPLPDRVQGAALFADISGFTPLTAALAEELGRQRGAEEVLNAINPIYEALIAELHRYRGSVIGFAGDSITCWLDGDDGRAAVACGLRMQAVMARVGRVTTPGGVEITLSIKIAVAAGPARRFIAGDPAVHTFDALAGATLARMAAAEHVAERGEVVVSEEVVASAASFLRVKAWRDGEEPGRRFAVVIEGEEGMGDKAGRTPWGHLPLDALTEAQLRAWIDAPVYERLASGATYVAELRPVTSLFLKFGGIDYDGDDAAGEKLDAFVRWVQSVLARYEGTMLQLTIGDKGSNLLAVFGAPVAHDDDDARAVAAGLDLAQAPPALSFISAPQIGISRGLAWAGACGGRLRCIYSVMGDEVNMAARLMGKASPGEIWVNQRVADAVEDKFRFRALGGIQVKGRETPLPVSVAMERRDEAVRGLRALFTGPLVGREDVLDKLRTYLAAAREGQGQVLRIQGVAGVGKSHLVAVFAGQAVNGGWRVVEGFCQSIAQDMAYTSWRQLLSALLDLSDGTPEDRAARLSVEWTAAHPELAPRLPLLADVLGLPLPDNDLTASFDARMRQQALLALVVEIVQTWAERQPLLLVLEDAHWMDEASAALTVAVARAIRHSTAVLLLVQRPPLRADQPIMPALEALDYHQAMALEDLSPEGVAGLARARLDAPVAPLALDLIRAQSQGNPFFTEELVDALREAGYLVQDEDRTWHLPEMAFNALLDGGCIERVVEAGEVQWRMVADAPLSSVALDIPDSVHGTVLARMDRLPERHKLTLKVASVIGRTFGLRMLRDVHPAHPGLARLRGEIEEVGRRDFVRLETGDPDNPVYIFKHNTTQEVAYGTLLFAQRQALHTAAAGWYEHAYGGDAPVDALTLGSPLAPHYPVLVYHTHHAEDRERELVYAGLAGEQAAKRYANESALRYLGRALALTPDEALEDRYRLLLAREKVYDVLGDRELQGDDLASLAVIAEKFPDDSEKLVVNLRQARYRGMVGEYAGAVSLGKQIVKHAKDIGNTAIEMQGYFVLGRNLARLGRNQEAELEIEQSLELARVHHDPLHEARSFNELAAIYYETANYVQAERYYVQAQARYEFVGYRLGSIQCLTMLGMIQDQLGHYLEARGYYEQALLQSREVGWRFSESHILGVLGANQYDLGNYASSRTLYEQALTISQEIGYQYS